MLGDRRTAAASRGGRSLEGPPNEEFHVDWSARATELVEKYDPALVWFDWWIEQPAFKPYLREFTAATCRTASQAGGLNRRSTTEGRSSPKVPQRREQIDAFLIYTCSRRNT